MILGKRFQQRVKELVHDPIFQKPIQKQDFSKKGNIILVTRIKPTPNGNNRMV